MRRMPLPMIDARHVDNPEHEVLKLDLAKHLLDVDGVVVGAVLQRLRAFSLPVRRPVG